MLINEITDSSVIVRVNYDLPSLHDTARIVDSLNTLKLLHGNGNKIIILSHWGRPKNQDIQLSMRNQLQTISDIFSKHSLPVPLFYNQFKSFEDTKVFVGDQAQDSIILLENTRFDSREQSVDNNLQRELALEYAKIGKYFVDEAFAVSHRSEVTNTTIKEYMMNCLGVSFVHETEVLARVIEHPERPLIIVMGGAKLETKLPLIQKMIVKADKLILCGLLAFTFIQAERELYPHLDSVDIAFPFDLVETNFLPIAKDILLNYPDKIVLPLDFEYNEEVPLDVGNKSLEKFIEVIQNARTIFWNGTLGKYEQKPFDNGTRKLAQYIGEIPNCFSVVGGGDTVSALDTHTLANFTFVSMGGGATLEFLGK